MATEKFEFRPWRNSDFPSFLSNEEAKKSLHKWSMQDGISVQGFTFNCPFKPYLMESFVQDFFSSTDVIQNLHKCNSNRRLVPVGIPAESVRMRRLKCSLTTMSVFDSLSAEERVVTKNGFIRRCIDDFVSPWLDEGNTFGDSIPVENELRKMFLLPQESDFSDVFSNEEKDEFLVRIFGHLVIGGLLCQYEDILQPYLKLTKLIYKDLVNVLNNTEPDGTPIPCVTSEVIQILSARFGKANDVALPNEDLFFEKRQFNNFLYLVVDPLQRTVKTFYHHA